jgi:hypothetical protein
MRVVVLQQSKKVAPIFFNVPEARDHLLKHGRVYTLRRKRKSVGETTAREGNLFKFRELGRVNVEFVRQVSGPAELEPYVGESGFRTVEEWASKAAPGADHLYRVSRV